MSALVSQAGAAFGKPELSQDEFERVMLPEMGKHSEDDKRLEKALAVLDEGGTGVLDRAYLVECLTKYGSQPLTVVRAVVCHTLLSVSCVPALVCVCVRVCSCVCVCVCVCVCDACAFACVRLRA